MEMIILRFPSKKGKCTGEEVENIPGNSDPSMEPLKARNGRHHSNSIVYVPNPPMKSYGQRK